MIMKERMARAVEMILQNRGDGWFMIFEESGSEKFVQFAFDEDGGLIFDLPFQALTTDENTTAARVLADLGVQAESAPVLDGLDGDEIGQQCSFQANVGYDRELAVALAYRVFRDVYGFADDTRFDVTIMR
jgi:hypothetical protein